MQCQRVNRPGHFLREHRIHPLVTLNLPKSGKDFCHQDNPEVHLGPGGHTVQVTLALHIQMERLKSLSQFLFNFFCQAHDCPTLRLRAVVMASYATVILFI